MEGGAFQAAGIGGAGGGNQAAVQAALQAALQLTSVRRDVYEHDDAKEKSLLNRRTTLLFLLYPLAVGGALGARLACFSLITPTPNTPGATPLVTPPPNAQNNMWNTGSHIHEAVTYISFSVILFVHLAIVLHLKLRTHERGLRLYGCCPWVFPLVFWLVTSLFYLTFISLSRYGVSVKDIGTAMSFSFFILVLTVILRLIKIPVTTVLGEQPAPNPVDNPVALAAAAATAAAAAVGPGGNAAVANLAAAAAMANAGANNI